MLILETNSSINTGPSNKIHYVYNFLQHCSRLLCSNTVAFYRYIFYVLYTSPSSVHLIIFLIRVDDAHLIHLALKSEMMCKHQLLHEPALILKKEAARVNRESRSRLGVWVLSSQLTQRNLGMLNLLRSLFICSSAMQIFCLYEKQKKGGEDEREANIWTEESCFKVCYNIVFLSSDSG